MSDQWDEKAWNIVLELERTIGFYRHHEWPPIIATALRSAVEAERSACEAIAREFIDQNDYDLSQEMAAEIADAIAARK